MNIEEIKRRRIPFEGKISVVEADWLIAEVERLEDELNAAKFVNCERCVEKTATRCADIAYNHAGKYGRDAIRKEFNLCYEDSYSGT